jgi:carboxyl-terminal processing protease
MRTYRSVSAALVAIVGSAIIGGLFGSGALATNDDRLPERYKVFTAALSAIEANYVEPVESEKLVYGAINGMLTTLDPHSSFMDPRQYAQMRERQEGRYYGLGISIVVVEGDITVAAIFEGSPAYKKGIRRGDIVARIGAEDAKGWTSDQAVKKLRGPKGTTVALSIKRRGYDRLIDLEVPRDEINIPTIPAAFMIDDVTGYIRLQDFAENTDRDLGVVLRDLSSKGMRRILLDLRGNPGGPLDQANRVASRFLPKGSLIVYTSGRIPNSDQRYRVTEGSQYTEQPLVVLVNRNSASASEIVAGALQDHDRALIVGETTFGKALVQSVYSISQRAGLALTTAHYYTPSGRLIQRPWDGSFDEYLSYSLREQSDERARPESELRYTDAGRKVYGGGGVEPDRRMEGPLEGFNPSRFGRSLYARQAFASYAQKFSAEGDTRVTQQSTERRTVTSNFVVDDEMLRDFRAHLAAEQVKIDEEAFARDLTFVRAMIKYEIEIALFGVSAARRSLAEDDPQVQYALQQFAEAERLTQMVPRRAARLQ